MKKNKSFYYKVMDMEIEEINKLYQKYEKQSDMLLDRLIILEEAGADIFWNSPVDKSKRDEVNE